jgi:hypothetical protein
MGSAIVQHKSDCLGSPVKRGSQPQDKEVSIEEIDHPQAIGKGMNITLPIGI